jgi:hypothetical protein
MDGPPLRAPAQGVCGDVLGRARFPVPGAEGLWPQLPEEIGT